MVVVPVVNQRTYDLAMAWRVQCVEIRADADWISSVGDLCQLVDYAKKRGICVVVTLKKNNRKDEDWIVRAVAAVQERADWIDLEQCKHSQIQKMVEKRPSQFIFSLHDFHGMPPVEVLECYVLNTSPSIAKVAVTPRTKIEQIAFMQVALRHAMVAVPMGEENMASRLAISSLFYYAYIEAPNAPGQLPYFSTCLLTGCKDL